MLFELFACLRERFELHTNQIFCMASTLNSPVLFLLCSLHSDVAPHKPPRHKRGHPPPSKLCESCQVVFDKTKQRYNQTWRKQEENLKKIRSELKKKCNAFDKAIITQANTPVGSRIVYEGVQSNSVRVTEKMFRTFVKKQPFKKKLQKTCAIVGNGGILNESGCGKMINSAQFVIRCNLPPLGDDFEEDVGNKTDFVTANPSIFVDRYDSLLNLRRPFVESLRRYGNSLMLLSPFSFPFSTPVCMRAIYSIEDFEIPVKPILLNSKYLQNLLIFWKSKGLQEARLTTGLLMVSLALELCDNVHLYGFWPFSNHPHKPYGTSHHYYDDRKPSRLHTMPAEFDLLLKMHSQGILRLHLGDCKPGLQ
ncbi:alpha-2,8-sialyltransferase 8E-like [Plectropomus leopardus]|uniref:alpha-2,8-sialyltransferase 8E-like n=1 Tax=Plectropomus leopardus TaxID=160734 RepID=UPI001C4A8EDB|nr:alpha-2,8-sialyltransferase 8E-like [Plectropomus leopardus]